MWLDSLPASSPNLNPAGALLTRLRAAARRGVARRFTVPGTGGALSVRLESLTTDADAAQLAVGQLGTLRAVGTEMRWRDVVAQRVELSCSNVHVRPSPRPTAVAAPVTVEVLLTHDVVRAWIAAARPSVQYDMTRGQAQLRWSAHPRWGAVEIVPEVTARELILRPAGIRVGPARFTSPRWAPIVRVKLARLPRGLVVRDVSVGDQGITVRATADEWSASIPTLLDLLS